MVDLGHTCMQLNLQYVYNMSALSMHAVTYAQCVNGGIEDTEDTRCSVLCAITRYHAAADV